MHLIFPGSPISATARQKYPILIPIITDLVLTLLLKKIPELQKSKLLIQRSQSYPTISTITIITSNIWFSLQVPMITPKDSNKEIIIQTLE
jgi:hypothetical protein